MGIFLYVQPSCYPDIAVRREVKKLKVTCSNKKFGCDFIGVLEEYFDVSEPLREDIHVGK